MSTPPKPGHTLDEPFNLTAAAADLLAVSEYISELTQDDDGTASTASAIEQARRVAAALSARISQHTKAQ